MRFLLTILSILSLLKGVVINDIIVRSEGMNTKLIIESDGPFIANAFSLKDPARMVIDCSGVSSNLTGRSYVLNTGGIKDISVTGFAGQPNLIRIVAKLNQDYSFLTATEGNNFVVTLLTGLTAPIPTWQAITTQASAPVPAEAPPPVVPITKPPVSITGRPISIDLENADILTVLRALSEYAGVNIVAGKDVKGTVTVRLHNVPWKQALEIILRAAGYAYREDPGVIRVDTAENLDKQDFDLPLISNVYKLEFATPGEMLTKIQAMLSPKGKANFY